MPNDPDFRSSRLSLLDRGVTFAIAHVRGGGEMGRRWYESGKYLQARLSFVFKVLLRRRVAGQRWHAPCACMGGVSTPWRYNGPALDKL